MMKHNFSFWIILFVVVFNLVQSSLKFNIPSNRDKCFQTELYIEGALLVRYVLSGFEEDYKDNEITQLFKNIKIFVKDEKGKYIYETELKNRKDKFVVHIKETGNYLVCARYYKPRREKNLSDKVVLGLKIRNDFTYTDVEHSLHKQDITEFWQKIWEIKKNMRPSIESAKIELNEEDKTAKSLISSVNTYYALCCLQLVIVFVSCIYVIFTSQDFLKKKSII